jgi:CBS domain-containing protein
METIRDARPAVPVRLVSVTSDAPVERAAQLRAETGASHLAVIDPVTHRPAGVLSTLDIARAVAAEPAASQAH